MARPSPSGSAPRTRTSWATAPRVRAAQMVGASTLLQPNSTDGHDRLGIEHGEGGRDHLAGHLTHDRAAAREVGRTVGQLHAAGERPRAGREPELGVGRVALGGEVHLARHRLERHGEPPRLRAAQLGHNCHPTPGTLPLTS